MTAFETAYFEFIKGHPCLRCGAKPPVSAHHMKGCISTKTGRELPRRRGAAYLWSIPLCDDCHQAGRDSIHAIGEEEFFRRLGKPPWWRFSIAGSFLAKFCMKLVEGTPAQ